MSSDDPRSQRVDESPTDASPDADASGDAATHSPESADSGESSPDRAVDRSLPEGFGEPAPDREASRFGGYALAGLLAVVFLVGFVRLTYPTASVMVVGTLLALFGVLVGLAAVWTRIRGS